MYNLFKAARNAGERFVSGAGSMPLWDRAKYAATPYTKVIQSAQAKETQNEPYRGAYYDIQGNYIGPQDQPQEQPNSVGDMSPIKMLWDEGTGTNTQADTFTPTPYEGKIYYTREDLAQAVNEAITKSYNDQIKKIDTNFKNGFITFDERDAEIKRVRGQLVDKRKGDLESIAGYMNQISPEAVQSGRNTMEGKAVEDYTTQNKQLGTELGSNLYDSSGRIRQNLTTADLQPYMTELSDTGNLARSIAGNYQERDNNTLAANTAFNSGKTQNANDYISSLPATAKVSDYSKYLNGSILNNQKTPTQDVGGFSSTAKTDKYGNPIDDYIYKGM